MGILNPGSRLEIKAARGRVVAEPAFTPEALVIVSRRGTRSSPDSVRIQAIETDGGVTICAVHPPAQLMGTGPLVENACAPGDWQQLNLGEDDDIVTDFLVKVPAGVRFAAWTAAAHVTLRHLGAVAEAGTISGNIQVVDYSGPESSVRSLTGAIGLSGPVAPGSVHRIHSERGTIVWQTPSIDGVELRASAPRGGIYSDFGDLAQQAVMPTPRRIVVDLNSRLGAVRVVRSP